MLEPGWLDMTDTIIRYKPNGERDYLRENFERERAERHSRKPSAEELELYWWILGLPFVPVTYLFRHGYGKHLLFLWFFGLPLLLFGWALTGVLLHIHADPSLFLAGWKAHFARHPDQAKWAWMIKDFVDFCRWL